MTRHQNQAGRVRAAARRHMAARRLPRVGHTGRSMRHELPRPAGAAEPPEAAHHAGALGCAQTDQQCSPSALWPMCCGCGGRWCSCMVWAWGSCGACLSWVQPPCLYRLTGLPRTHTHTHTNTHSLSACLGLSLFVLNCHFFAHYIS